MATRNNTDNTNINTNKNNQKIKMGRENNCMDISSDKQAKSHTRKVGYGPEKETLISSDSSTKQC